MGPTTFNRNDKVRPPGKRGTELHIRRLRYDASIGPDAPFLEREYTVSGALLFYNPRHDEITLQFYAAIDDRFYRIQYGCATTLHIAGPSSIKQPVLYTGFPRVPGPQRPVDIHHVEMKIEHEAAPVPLSRKHSDYIGPVLIGITEAIKSLRVCLHKLFRIYIKGIHIKPLMIQPFSQPTAHFRLLAGRRRNGYHFA
ncbi:MAG: hypothetical protein BWY96_01706 [Spirochaetes bacterium ADurb.BinA120]|nr:MAG: hypothetical protein BWY96_01706 [Spirochaetes bacterium ADurb.BinA120]